MVRLTNFNRVMLYIMDTVQISQKRTEGGKDVVIKEIGTVTLCAVQGCCPTVDFTDPQKVVLRDDFGGQVQLTREEWKDLKTKFTSKSDQQ